MKRAAIYARFSSDLQNDKSVDDQIAFCREICAREGLAVVMTFEDREISGAFSVNRPGFLSMMRTAGTRRFDVIVAESVDRLFRSPADYHTARRQLDYAGVAIHVAGGKVGKLDGALRAIVSEIFLDDLAVHVRRGLEAVIRSGRHAGGRAYGYDTTPGRPGEWTINQGQALVVRRIFAEYLAGERTPAIAARLNAEGTKPPRGKYWQPGALTGSNNRHNGILGNEIYCGRLVWNRVRMIKDPETGKRVSRCNPESEWQRADAPQLAIVTPEIFEQAQAIKAGRRKQAPALRRKPKALLSGLLRCGTCGGGMSIKGRDRGGARIVCTAHQNVKACTNNRSYYQHHIEETVLSGLRAHLIDPRAIRHFLKVYHDERKRLAASASSIEPALRRRLADATRRAARLTEAMLESDEPVAAFTAKLADLQKEKAEIESELARLTAPVNVVGLHPAAQEHYLKIVNDLASAIDARCGATEMATAIRDLIESVVVHRTEPGEAIRLKVNGRLAALIGAPAFPDGSLSGVKVVARGRYGVSPNCDIPVFSMECERSR